MFFGNATAANDLAILNIIIQGGGFSAFAYIVYWIVKVHIPKIQEDLEYTAKELKQTIDRKEKDIEDVQERERICLQQQAILSERVRILELILAKKGLFTDLNSGEIQAPGAPQDTK